MDFTFLKPSGEVAFFRSDAEKADWTMEEMHLTCIFPYLADKEITRGMTILFQDPATNDWQAYEVRKSSLFPGDGYQEVIGEDIAISELTDCHIPAKIEQTDVYASSALATLLAGTGWSIGNVTSNPISSGDFNRGSVWLNIETVVSNWNVYVTPRVTVGANGITGRYLDILPSTGTDRGLRLSVNKNITDPCVVYDDSELYTALYGYGGTYSEGSGDKRETLEYNFSEVVWAKTADHPAKPEGQYYIEYPEKTALYGRNGKPRFGYFQNVGIKDPEVLLQKTWESLKQCCDPKISISGTVADLKRMGYADVPLRLHDMAVIELEPLGVVFYKQIIRITVDLLDETKNLPEIGDYIPNIIYINRETEKAATGGGKGRGGAGASRVDLENSMYQTSIYDTGREVGMYARKVDEQGNILNQAGMHIDPETGVLIYATDDKNNIGSLFKVQDDKIEAEVYDRSKQGLELNTKITQNANAITLEANQRIQDFSEMSSRLTVQADRITAEVNQRVAGQNALSGRIDVQANKVSLVVEEKDGKNVVKAASIVAGINAQSGSYIKLQADKINMSGYVTSTQLQSTNASIDNLKSGNTSFTLCKAGSVQTGTLRVGGQLYVKKETMIPNVGWIHYLGY